MITGAHIENGSIRGVDIRNGSIGWNDLSSGTKQRLINRAAKAAVKSTPGSANAPGVAGKDGAKGDQGIQGIQGIQGAQGNQGAKGDKGDRGQNADGSVTVSVKQAGDGGFVEAQQFWDPALPLDKQNQNADTITATFGDGLLRFRSGELGGMTLAFGHSIGSKPVSKLETLRYKIERMSTTGTVGPVMLIDIEGTEPCASDLAGVTEHCEPGKYNDGKAQLRLEPGYAGVTTNGQALAPTVVNAHAATTKLWASQDFKGMTRGSAAAGRKTLAQILADNPNIKVTKISVAGYTGSTWKNFDGAVDFLEVGFIGEEVQRYDFG